MLAVLPLLVPLLSCCDFATEGLELPPGISVKFGRKSFKTDEPPEALGEAARRALAEWVLWADDNDYRIVLSDDQRVLFLTEEKGGRFSARRELTEEASEVFDELIVPFEAGSIEDRAEPEEAVAETVDSVPEDPEGDVVPFGGAFGSAPTLGEPIEDTTWGSGETFTPDGELLVIVVAEGDDEYGALLEELVRRDPSKRNWADEALGQAGFVLHRPLVGALKRTDAGQEEWNPKNEYVNRIAQLLFVRRFGEQPFWLQQGFAWVVEWSARKSFYCFPYRSGFVGVEEHSGWDVELLNSFKDRKDRPLGPEDFAHWQRGTYVGRYSRISWGLVTFLTNRDKRAFSAMLDDLRLYRHDNNRVDVGGGRWERLEGYEIPIEVQREVIEKHFGEKIWQEATRAFRRRDL